MKVLYVNTTITHYNHPLLNKVADKGCDLVMLIPRNNARTVGKGVKRNESDNQNYRVIATPSRKAWYGKDCLPELLSVVHEEQPDILLIGWPYMLQLFFYPKVLRYLDAHSIKLILHEIPFFVPPYGHLDYFKEHPVYDESMRLISKGFKFYFSSWLLMHIRRYLYHRADASLNYCSRGLALWPGYGVSKEKIFVRYNSGDTEAFFEKKEEVMKASALLPVCPQRILHIGRLVAWKRVDLLINAYEKLVLRFPDSELAIVGDGPELENLKKQASLSVAKDHIRFAGSVYDPFELGRYMKESSVYVLAGMGGLSINDAMCYELPVVCSVCDGTERDLVEDGKNGFFFKEGDADDLAAKIEAILADESKRKQMGQESLRIIEEKVNINTVADNYVKVFNYVVRQ
ncbi:MAG: glycosyltransferase family 4 protein [Paludibacteraceae bacterium]|nr:glycosyltransferase family 4 protein [Paludibacteraceae bacterium]